MDIQYSERSKQELQVLPEVLVLLLSQNFMVVCKIHAHKFPPLLFESTAMLHIFCSVHAFAEEKNVH